MRNLNAITVNYFTCLALGSLISGDWPFRSGLLDKNWFPYALFLSFVFIIFFNVNAYTIQKVGMVITSICQKLSLVFPVIVGVVLFGEELKWTSKIAIPLTITAIVLSNLPRKTKEPSLGIIRKYWYLPFLVFFGSGIVEVSLFFIQENGITGLNNRLFTTCLFGLAGVWGIATLLVKGQLNFNRNEILTGIALGIPNFFTIYLILRALEVGINGAVLFPVNNVGTIFFTALVAIFAFRENLSKANYFGLLLALISVLLFSLS